jgi:hypothetical protein
MRRRRMPALLLVVLLPSCAGANYGTTWGTAPLGTYDDYRPHATMSGRLVTVEMEREAHVAVIGVRAPRPGYESAPVFFEVKYPYTSVDRTRFPAGRHRMSPRPASPRAYRECETLEKPTIDGCRRRVLPGMRTVDDARVYPGPTDQHIIVVVADEPIDPYTLADALYFAAFENATLAAAFRLRDAPAAKAILERTLLDQKIATGWAGVYLTSR